MNNKYLIMNHEELMQTLKEMSFKELLNAYVESFSGKPFDVDGYDELTNADKELISDLDSVIHFKLEEQGLGMTYLRNSYK